MRTCEQGFDRAFVLTRAASAPQGQMRKRVDAHMPPWQKARKEYDEGVVAGARPLSFREGIAMDKKVHELIKQRDRKSVV